MSFRLNCGQQMAIYDSLYNNLTEREIKYKRGSSNTTNEEYHLY